ncbi:MAG: parvulin peptidyl-prolyl isomerase, partial [Ignavibacteria bacterium]|nr:parvulin peptidyl-prolyl isomerase [Ignavibacteria bacterium]
FEKNQLDKSLLDIIFKMKENDISFPKRLDIDANTYGYHIVKLIKRTPEHKADLEQDYSEIKRLAEYNKKQKLYTKWMDELREKIYWDIRL